MNKIKKLILEDVRCFQNEAIDIRPLTLLVGENSTGKSTALGCLQILGNFFNGKKSDMDFNSNAYQMGAFADIMRKSNFKNNYFKLGLEFFTDIGKSYTCVLFLRERETGSEPIIDKIQYTFDDGEVIIVNKKGTAHSKNLKITTRYGKNKFIVPYDDRINEFSIASSFLERLFFFIITHQTKPNEEMGNLMSFVREKLGEDYQAELLRPFYNTDSLAPIRSKPRRTYDPLKETADPEGSEVPMLIRNLKNREKSKWEKLHKQLVEFGKASGLFSDIVVRELGRAMNDPFQLQIKVKVKGPTVNLVDVGYGVGQILPILVRIFNARSPTMFLLQQPEMHLHPRGQAELPSLLVSMHKNFKHSFLVETHSDYVIDRTRILVRKKKIKPEDVSIVYFEPMEAGGAVKIHNMKVDEMGNLTNVPKNYRDFFTKETDTLLGFDEE